MDADYEDNLAEFSPSHALITACSFCRRTLSSDNDAGDLGAIGVCGDCKFLLLEDLETSSPDMDTSRLPVYGTSGSIDSMMFSQQFSQLINLARQNRPTFSDHDYQSVDGDGPARSVPHTSSRTTPSGSRRWRRVFSDTESDGFDSVYGESDSNVSFRRYSAYGGDSDASIDDFGRPNIESDLDSDTDIDPMNAGLYRWNSDEEDDSEWEEDEVGRSTILSRSLFLSSELSLGIPGRVQVHNYVGASGDYVGAGGFENLLERLAESESSTRGPPPASVSFVNNMPRVTINEDEPDSMACAVCKDSFIVGTVVNRLPCFHRFHTSCILPWLSTRNTCPLCRHEVPTDDWDYEARKRNRGNEYETRLPDVNYDFDIAVDEPSQSEHGREQDEEVVDEELVVNNGVTRNRWLLLAAPIVGIVGITLVLCFGNPLRDRKLRSERVSHRRENNNSQRRWWSFF